MENKANTLKDFWNILPINQLVFSNKTDVTLHRLREEIIKWIKQDIEDYRIADLHLPKPPVGINIHNFILQQRQKWKDRFNLTEEDLK
jgi:hypothetical protein